MLVVVLATSIAGLIGGYGMFRVMDSSADNEKIRRRIICSSCSVQFTDEELSDKSLKACPYCGHKGVTDAFGYHTALDTKVYEYKLIAKGKNALGFNKYEEVELQEWRYAKGLDDLKNLEDDTLSEEIDRLSSQQLQEENEVRKRNLDKVLALTYSEDSYRADVLKNLVQSVAFGELDESNRATTQFSTIYDEKVKALPSGENSVTDAELTEKLRLIREESERLEKLAASTELDSDSQLGRIIDELDTKIRNLDTVDNNVNIGLELIERIQKTTDKSSMKAVNRLVRNEIAKREGYRL